MNVVPAFLRDKREPIMPTIPQPEPSHRPKAVVDFLTATDQMREELAYFKSHAGQLEVDLKFERERNRSLESELAHVRNDRDYLCTHDATMLAGLRHLKIIINDLEEQSRAQAYAPPGSGQEQPAPPVTEHDEEILKGMTMKLAPGPDNA